MRNPRRKVVGVLDGDTIRLTRKIQGTDKIRLAGVNAPEMGSRAGEKARNVLRGMVGGKQVIIEPVGRSYDRVVANVKRGHRSVNKRMREKGY